MLDQLDDAAIERLFAINAVAPVQLTRALLPTLRSQPGSAILNIGSVFGSLGYPGFTAYSATKFALRGFTEALRRELADSKVGVHYFAPRATRTGMNASAVDRMNAFLEAGADLVFPAGMQPDRLGPVRSRIKGKVMVTNFRGVSVAEEEAAGADVVLYYGFCLYAAFGVGLSR
jgi:short-subunit dehydrogenase